MKTFLQVTFATLVASGVGWLTYLPAYKAWAWCMVQLDPIGPLAGLVKIPLSFFVWAVAAMLIAGCAALAWALAAVAVKFFD
jgi:hypothetical protein